MESIISTTVENIEETLVPFKFTFDENGLEQTISDKDLNSESACTGYARKEFMENGMDVQEVTFSTYSRGLNINDIVSIVLPDYNIPVNLSKNNFIVMDIVTSMVGAKMLDTIKGVRYD